MNRRVMFMRLSGGRCPVREFLDELAEAERLELLRTLKLIEVSGYLPAGAMKKLRGSSGIWEIRMKGGIRVLCFTRGDEVWLTHGFRKKRDRVPIREIRRAQEMRRQQARRRR